MSFISRFLVVLVIVTALVGVGFVSMGQFSNTNQGSTYAWLDEIVPTAGEQSDADDTKVIATVNNNNITQMDVYNAIAQLPPAMQQLEPKTLTPVILDQLINAELIEQAAIQNGLSNDEEVIKEIASARDQIIRNVFIERQIAQTVSDEAVQAAYEEFVSEQANQQEVKASHILLKEEAEALAVIAELQSGADFAELAKEKSTGPSAPRGGDLGYFVAADMVAPFAEAAFALNAGAYTQTPVQTQFGYHVIMVEDKRMRPAPSLEDVRPMLVQKLERDAFEKMVEGLRAEANIQMMIEPASGAQEIISPASETMMTDEESMSTEDMQVEVEPHDENQAHEH